MWLGNMSLDEIQKRAGVDFPSELIEFMSDKKQEAAENIKYGFWHCFDMPFMIVCGDEDTAKFIYNHLKDKSKDFIKPLQIGIQE